MPDSAEVSIVLAADEAVVLFELLHGWEDADEVASPEYESELVALWSLSAALERQLSQPFDPHYDRLVSEARARLTPTD